MSKKIIGLSAYYHDSAVCYVEGGEIKFASQEERFSRIKNDETFPNLSLKYLLNKFSITLNEIDEIIFYEKPLLKFERLMETYVTNVPYGFSSFKKAIPLWSKEKLFQKENIFKELKNIDQSFNDINKISFSEHHLSHAASAFYPSPFEEAIILTMDGVGEWSTTSICIGKKNKITKVKDIDYPDSLGLLYSSFTYFLGFKVNEGEYKVMGLAPYGETKYKDLIYENLIDVKDDGSFMLNQKYFNYSIGLTMTNKNFSKLFNIKPRKIDSPILQIHMDIAASVQVVLEEIVIKICKNLSNNIKIKNLCLAGGVALNCVTNGKVLNKNFFENIWIQPAAGDAGGALGAALLAWYSGNNEKIFDRKKSLMKNSYLGFCYDDDVQIENKLKDLGAVYKKIEKHMLPSYVAKLLADQKIIGWYQGKSEFGPRALGNRSILADPRSEKMQKNLNLKIKFRESFRPFAPAVLEEESKNWFNIKNCSPFMLFVAQVKEDKLVDISESDLLLNGFDKLNIKRSLIPSVTHVDNSARIQTVTKESNQLFYELIKSFDSITQTPILLNTSFNVKDEPIVNTIEDAYSCFLSTDLDYLVCSNFLLKKEDQFDDIN